jgi:hypothetical protein
MLGKYKIMKQECKIFQRTILKYVEIKPYINQFDVENRLNSNVQCIVGNPQLIMLRYYPLII